MDPKFTTLATVLEQAVADYVARRDDILDTVVLLRVNRLIEQCRRHLGGLTLKSTYNTDRIRTLEKLVADLRTELAPLVEQVLVKRTQLAFAEQELADYRRTEATVQTERDVRQATGMYAEAARFADLLFSDHQIDRGDFAALNPSDIKAIAAIIDARAAPKRTRAASAAAVAKARKR